MTERILRYRFSDSKWPSESVHCKVTTKYNPETDQLTKVWIVHDETFFSDSIDAIENGAKELIIQYPFPSDVCPACSDHQPVLVWSDEIEPVEEWSYQTDVEVVRA